MLNTKRLLSYALTAGLCLGAASTWAASPSFNCAKATHEVEKLICNDADLEKLDRSLSSLYGTLLKNTPASKQKGLKIDAYLDGMARIAAEDRRQREARREEIEGRLATPGLGDADRKAVSSELDSLDQLQQSLDDRSSGDSEDAEKTPQTRRTIAAAFIRQWKLNQALYQQYGGRIIVQQGGPEPLDAYRTFLGDEQRHGAFEFLDRSLEAAFWRYYLTDSMHSFYPPGSKEERQAFQTPWWQ